MLLAFLLRGIELGGGGERWDRRFRNTWQRLNVVVQGHHEVFLLLRLQLLERIRLLLLAEPLGDLWRQLLLLVLHSLLGSPTKIIS